MRTETFNRLQHVLYVIERAVETARTGKVPANIVERFVGKNRIQGPVLEKFMPFKVNHVVHGSVSSVRVRFKRMNARCLVQNRAILFHAIRDRSPASTGRNQN